jgi:hypothetical protein
MITGTGNTGPCLQKAWQLYEAIKIVDFFSEIQEKNVRIRSRSSEPEPNKFDRLLNSAFNFKLLIVFDRLLNSAFNFKLLIVFVCVRLCSTRGSVNRSTGMDGSNSDSSSPSAGSGKSLVLSLFHLLLICLSIVPYRYCIVKIISFT